MAVSLTLPYRYRNPRRHVKNDPADTAEIQEYLRAVSFYDESVPRIAVDGIFGRETTQAVAAFQNGRALPETGRVDRATWDALYAMYLAILELRSPPQAVSPFPGSEVSLKPGDAGDAVTILQMMLSALARRFSNLSGPTVTGRYDDATKTAVSGFQKACGFEPDGHLDKPAWNLLAQAYHSYNQS